MQVMHRVTKTRNNKIWVTSKRFQGGFVPSDMPIIKRKWRSVDVVGKITETMRNVAAGKLPSAERFIGSTRPFAGSVDKFFEVEEDPADVNKIMHVIVGCERGLCGVVGANLPKIVTTRVRKSIAQKDGKEHQIVAMGKKTFSKIRATCPDQVKYTFQGMRTKMPTFMMCLEIVDRMKAEEYDKMVFYYNYYQNSTTFLPQTVTLYNQTISETIAEEQFADYDLEGDEALILENFHEFKQATTLYFTQAENLASEMGSRLQSMDGASKTCKEKSTMYEQVYQRLRKTKITNELTVLSTGAKLSKKSKG